MQLNKNSYKINKLSANDVSSQFVEALTSFAARPGENRAVGLVLKVDHLGQMRTRRLTV